MSKTILIRPLVTEKMTDLMEKGHYAFVVAQDANKIEIRNAIQARYPNITIKEVRTMVVRGKRRNQMTRKGVQKGRRSGYKKAIVTLTAESERLDFYENV